MQTVLTEEASRAINAILETLLDKVEAEAVFLCDRGGNIVAEYSMAAYPNIENIGALAAGSFFATLELARLVGEPQFRCMNHQGEKTSMYMEGLNEDLLLVIVFGKDSNIGLVKLYAKHVGRELAKFNIAVDTSEGGDARMSSVKLEIDENAQAFVRFQRED
jgi:predicted regulator of Ras-like GTPase activity (Roadblock/LC7/MglB family)